MRCVSPGPSQRTESPEDFKAWLKDTFGPEQCRLFFFPYNRKVWRYPLEKLSYDWISQRINIPDQEKGEQEWGPNHRFRYPSTGGMGALWKNLARKLTSSGLLKYRREIVDIDIEKRQVIDSEGRADRYHSLISTIPLTALVKSLKGNAPNTVIEAADQLRWNSGLVTGIGFAGPTSQDVSWAYYPEPEFPFYRVTALSSYAPDLVPEGKPEKYCSFLCESTMSPSQGPPSGKVILDGLLRTRMPLPEKERAPISITQIPLPFSYPLPTLERDRHLETIQGFLHSLNIFSRGRFGGWRYEIGNMDHSLLQGLEVVDRIMLGNKETFWVN